MSQYKSKFWFVPRKELFVPREYKDYSGTALRHANSRIDPSCDQIVKNGESFTLLLKSFYVVESYDKGGNDILVQSLTKYGSDPQIEGAHFFRKDLPSPYFCHHDLIANHIFSHESHVDANRVWIKLQILEIDGKKVDQFAQVVDTELRDTVQMVGAIFPGTLPFVANISDDAFTLFSKLKKLASNKDHTVFEQALDFYSINSGETLFRYGVYVLFQQPIEGDRYCLKEFQIEPRIDKNSTPLHGESLPDYVVIEVVPGVVNSFAQDEIIANQNLAAGLLPFDESFADPGEKDEHFHYLKRLMKKAQTFDDIYEYYSLVRQTMDEGIQDKNQQKRYRDLTLKLSEYVELIQEILEE